MGFTVRDLANLMIIAGALLAVGCSTGKPLPASWPNIGLTLPGSAEVKKLHKAFSLYTHDGVYAHKEDGDTSLWAVCFTCPGGITQAYIHVDAELKRHGFKETTAEEYPTQFIGGVTGSHGVNYLWISDNKRTGVTLSLLDDLSDKAREEIGELCLMITKDESTADNSSQPSETNTRFFKFRL